MRLIDADAILEKKFEAYDYDPIEVVEVCDIEDAPTIEAEPVKYGEWIYGEFDVPHCSECGAEPKEISPYCPNCGAKMDLEEQK